MKLLLSLLLLSSVAYATKREDKDLQNEMLEKEVKTSGYLLTLKKNKMEMNKLDEEMNLNKSSSIVSFSSNSVFINNGQMIKKLSVGDRLDGSYIKEISINGITLSNGKKINVF